MSLVSRKLVSIVIPVYCNEQSLEILMSRLQIEQEKNPIYNFEYIFVDDGSKDNSLKTLLKLKEEFKQKIVIVQLSKNFGQLAAMKAGYSLSSGDLLVSISADLQDPTTLVSEMLDLN